MAPRKPASLAKRVAAMAPAKAPSKAFTKIHAGLTEALEYAKADQNPLLSEPKSGARNSAQAHEERIAVAFLEQCQHSLDAAKASTGDTRRYALDDLRLYAEKAALQAARAS